jgi:two-component system sensor histidine kinase/response regulator
MSEHIIKALLIEDDPSDAEFVREALAGAEGLELEWIDRLDTGIERLRRPGVDVVLLDLALPEARGLETLRWLSQAAPQIPIVALSPPEDRDHGGDAIKFGAEDYLVKGAFTADLLTRSIRYAIDRRQAREEIAQARDSALESARLRGEFLANMSHEIRTPLNGIVGMTRLLTDTPLSHEQREMIEIARQSADSLLKIVNDILDFSKISAGKVALEETDFDLGTAVESVIALFAEAANRKGVELAAYVDSELPVALRGDPARLCQVLTNLVGNAVKFTPHGEVALRASLVRDSGDALTVRFTVKDTGIGIPLESQRHLFQAFAQADGSTTRKFGGTGLGLAICAQLVELMDGNIGVRSEPGGGSAFWFTATFRKQPASAASESTASARLAGMRMLVTDHSPTAAHIVQQHAVAWGIRCAIATTAAETMVALTSAAIARHHYDVVLIEVQNPSLDGLTLARAIKADRNLAHTRVLGMYSLGARPDDSAMRAAGIRALLVKPIKQTQFFNTLSVTMAAIEEAGAPKSGAPSTPARRRRVSELKSLLPAEVRARIRILLVEDNAVNRQVQLRMLERIGFAADSVNNGREALAAHEHRPYGLVLMDCQMPEMDGYTATREIRRREASDRHTVIIGVTARALAGDREECLAAGMDDYVSKPIVPEDLAATLERWAKLITESSAADAEPLGAAKVEKVPDHEILDQEILAELRDCQRPGETDFVTKLLGVFINDLTVRLEKLEAAFSRGDRKAVHDGAHALKGASSEIGARRLAQACERLEAGAKGGDLSVLKTLVARIEHEANQLRAALEVQLTSPEA